MIIPKSSCLKFVGFFILQILLFAGCKDSHDYGINAKQPIAPGQEIFHAEFDPLMGNDIHMFIDHVYTYEGIEGEKIKIKYKYTEQYMGKTTAKAEDISTPIDNNHEAMLETKPVYPNERKGRKLILKIVDEQSRISVKPLWIAAKITKSEALNKAEKVCKAEGWSFEDVSVKEYDSVWSVLTHKSRLGGNATIDIDKETGEIVKKWFNPK